MSVLGNPAKADKEGFTGVIPSSRRGRTLAWCLVGAAVLCGTWASTTPTLPRLNLSHTSALPDTPVKGHASGGCSRTQ
ncbi:MAG: hypothetical protein ACKO3H_07140 [Verrucomicrobiota bacterium]